MKKSIEKKRKRMVQLLVDFVFDRDNGGTKEYRIWLENQRKKNTGLCSLFDMYAEKIMKEMEIK